MLSQVNASQNSRQTIGNTHDGFQPLINIIIKRLDNIKINESYYYLKEVIKKECQKETIQKKQTNSLPDFKETIKVEDKQKRYRRDEALHSLSYSVIEIAQDLQANMSLRMFIDIKIYHN